MTLDKKAEVVESVIKSIVGSLAVKALEEAIKKGKTIEIPSLNIKIKGK